MSYIWYFLSYIFNDPTLIVEKVTQASKISNINFGHIASDVNITLFELEHKLNLLLDHRLWLEAKWRATRDVNNPVFREFLRYVPFDKQIQFMNSLLVSNSRDLFILKIIKTGMFNFPAFRDSLFNLPGVKFSEDLAKLNIMIGYNDVIVDSYYDFIAQVIDGWFLSQININKASEINTIKFKHYDENANALNNLTIARIDELRGQEDALIDSIKLKEYAIIKEITKNLYSQYKKDVDTLLNEVSLNDTIFKVYNFFSKSNNEKNLTYQKLVNAINCLNNMTAQERDLLAIPEIRIKILQQLSGGFYDYNSTHGGGIIDELMLINYLTYEHPEKVLNLQNLQQHYHKLIAYNNDNANNFQKINTMSTQASKELALELEQKIKDAIAVDEFELNPYVMCDVDVDDENIYNPKVKIENLEFYSNFLKRWDGKDFNFLDYYKDSNLPSNNNNRF